jgi:hypothetical protein
LSFSIEFYSLKNREVNIIQWYSNYNSVENVIIAEFGWDPVFMYFGYPFEDRNASLALSDVIYFLMVSTDYLKPSLHIQNGTNLLTDLKNSTNMDVFLIVTDHYLLLSGLELFGRLTEEEIELYYNLPYLNRVCSSKSENGDVIPLYWVI